MDEIVGGSQIYSCLTPVHEIFAIDFGCYLTTIFDFRDNRAGLAAQVLVLAFVGIKESRTIFGPLCKILACGNRETGNRVIPRCICHHIDGFAIDIGSYHTRVFAAAFPFVRLGNFCLVRIEHRCGTAPVNCDTVARFSKTDTRCASSDSCVGIIFRTVEDVDFAVFYYGCRIEGVGKFPFHFLAFHRAVEYRSFIGRNDRIYAFGADKSAKSPIGKRIVGDSGLGICREGNSHTCHD